MPVSKTKVSRRKRLVISVWIPISSILSQFVSQKVKTSRRVLQLIVIEKVEAMQNSTVGCLCDKTDDTQRLVLCGEC